MLTSYLNALKTKGNFTYDSISKLSGVPEATIKNIFSGKTEDPRFDTVSAIVASMGGSLDAVYTVAKKEDVETNSVLALKETYEQRIKETNEHYQQRITDIKEHYEDTMAGINAHIATIQLDKRWFRIATCISSLALVAILIADVLLGNVGWIRY